MNQNTKPNVSVVIPAYNCSKTIGQTIDAVNNQQYPGVVETIVVNDGSKDNTLEVLSGLEKIKIVDQENAGPAAARNEGLKNSTGDIILFTDSDCIPEADWIEKIIRHYDDPEVGVVAGSYGIMNGENLLAACIQKEIRYRHDRLMPKYPKSFGSYNFSSRKEILNKVNGFDTGYRYASGEDNDLSYKILKAGYKIYFEKEALVKHYHTSRVSRYLKEQYQHGFWRVKMYLDHPDMARGDDYTFWKDIAEIPLTLIFVGSCIGVFFGFFIFENIAILSITVLAVIQIYYAWIMTKSIKSCLFFSAVMMLRSFARTFGFLSGIISFLPQKYFKKS